MTSDDVMPLDIDEYSRTTLLTNRRIPKVHATGTGTGLGLVDMKGNRQYHSSALPLSYLTLL